MDYEGKITYIMSVMKMHPDAPELVATAVLAAEIAELRKSITGAIKSQEEMGMKALEEIMMTIAQKTNPVINQITNQINRLANLIEKAPMMRMAISKPGQLIDGDGKPL